MSRKVASATYKIIEMLKELRTRFRRKDTDASRVLAMMNSVHRSPWHIAPAMKLVVATTASKLTQGQS